MDADMLVRTLGPDGCFLLGTVLAAAVVFCTIIVCTTVGAVAELWSKERLESARGGDPEAAAREAARLESRERVLRELREDGCHPDEAREWLELHDC